MHFGWHVSSSSLVFKPFSSADIVGSLYGFLSHAECYRRGFVRTFRIPMCHLNKGVMDNYAPRVKEYYGIFRSVLFAFFILRTSADTNYHPVVNPPVSIPSPSSNKVADSVTFSYCLSSESLSNCKNEKSQCIMLRILKAHRFMQGKSLCTFITNFFYSLSRGLLSDDNYELKQKHFTSNHAVPAEPKDDRK